MRNRLLLIATALLFSACADDQHSTAPGSRTAGSRSASGDVAPSTQGIKVPQAKPTDQVGFTTITLVSSDYVHVTPGQSAQTTATCPAGSTAIGGSYTITLYLAGSIPPLTRRAGLDGQNGWTVNFSNEPVGSGYYTYYATAYCAS